MTKVFVLQHSYSKDGVEESKMIGVYSTENDAQSAIDRLKHKPGFARWPKDFTITEYTLNEDDWTEGFAVLSLVQARDKNNEWTSVMMAEVDEGIYQVVDRAAEDFLLDLKENDLVRVDVTPYGLSVISKIDSNDD